MDFVIEENDMNLLDNLHDPNRKQVALDNLQEKFTLPAGYKLKLPKKPSSNSLISLSPACTRTANVMG